MSNGVTVRAVAGIWREVLCADMAPETDVNFFDAGGTSLGLLRMQTMLNERFGLDLGGVELFEHTTIEKLAAFIAQSKEKCRSGTITM